ncbi:Corticotropin-releasing factor receptor 2-like 1 [Homarus americanus]|uniref:Corticotropin-releasing factor receptor 2-like 1 n=1 Tax=Homarus americanus TaxID=6706 RepID=A0A8J5NBR9_HOMAM|nr:Corticotropin-releasing factor receptor 2-like 1 [Homarus americanus]
MITFAYRECDGTGSWLRGGWTNYSQCLSVIENQGVRSGVLDAVRYITFIGALLSLLTLILTIFVFTYFRTLECDRLRVHRNLVVSLIVRFLVMLILTEPFIFHRHTTTYRDVDWLCKTLLALTMYAQMASINWMFVEGLFLHSRLTSNVFDSGAPFTLYYMIGWGWPMVFLAAWATTMALHYPVQCWRGYGNLPYVWILVAPMVTALMVGPPMITALMLSPPMVTALMVGPPRVTALTINLLFLINIVRILVTKLRASDAQVRKAIKATAVLFPLLGITNMLFAINPGDKGNLEGAYMLTNAILQSTQGVFVSVLYCFVNGEVQELLRKRWRQYRMRQLSQTGSPHRKSTRGTIIFEPSLSFRLSANTPSPLLMSPQTPNSQQMSSLMPTPLPLSPECTSSHFCTPQTPRSHHSNSQPLSIQPFDPKALKKHHLPRNQSSGPLLLRFHSSDHPSGATSQAEHDLMISSV